MLQLTRWRWLPNKLLGTLRMREILLCCFKLGFWISGTITKGKIALNCQWVLKTLMPYLKLPISNRQAVRERNNQLAKKDVLSSRAMIEQCSSRKLFLESCRSLKRLAVELRRVACSSSSQADVMLNSDIFMSCLPPRDCAYCGLLLAFYDLTSPQNHFLESYITQSRLLDWVMPVAALGITPFNRGTSADCIILLVIERKQYKTNRHCSETSWNDENLSPKPKKAFYKISGLRPSLDPFWVFWVDSENRFVWWISFIIHQTCRNF